MRSISIPGSHRRGADPPDDGDTTLPGTLEAGARNLAEVSLAPTLDEPCALVGDKGYHSRARAAWCWRGLATPLMSAAAAAIGY